MRGFINTVRNENLGRRWPPVDVQHGGRLNSRLSSNRSSAIAILGSVNTGTRIVTVLMVFLIQDSQNRDGAAMQAKLDELLGADKASEQLIGIEHLTDDQIEFVLQRLSATPSS